MEGFPWDDLRKNFTWMSADGQRTKWHRNIAENVNRLSRVQERYRETDDRQTDGWRCIAIVNVSSRSLIKYSLVHNVPTYIQHHAPVVDYTQQHQQQMSTKASSNSKIGLTQVVKVPLRFLHGYKCCWRQHKINVWMYVCQLSKDKYVVSTPMYLTDTAQ